MRGTQPSPLRPSPQSPRSLYAIVAGAAILAGATLSAAQAQPGGSDAGGFDDAAAAAPDARIGVDGDGVSLPRPLSDAGAARVRRMFSAQARGDIPAALRDAAQLEEPLLLGHLLAQRYLGGGSDAPHHELNGWLGRFADHPDAPAIRALLHGTGKPKRPQHEVSSATESCVPLARNPWLDRTVAQRAHDGQFRSALSLIARTRGLLPHYALQLRAEVARAQFTRNDDPEALATAASAIRRAPAGQDAQLAGYIAGLAAWRLGHPDLARGYFDRAYHAADGTPETRAAAAYWASRTEARVGHDDAATLWLRRAAAAPASFHGMIARTALGYATGDAMPARALTQADVDTVAATPAGRRAFALLQVGEPTRAEAEMRGLRPRAMSDVEFARALALVVDRIGFADLSAHLADLAQAEPQIAAIPRLRPRGGFQFDPALVYALTRLESNFDANAISRVGARGLMQLMPVTAGYISGDRSLASGGASRLHDPALNLDLGQRYVAYLAQHDRVDGDLIRVLSCYNSGPANYLRWSAAMRDGGDPMMFVEAIPNDETRGFVKHVLTYTWLYAARLGLPAPSLGQIAAGRWPRFTQLEKQASIDTPAPTIH